MTLLKEQRAEIAQLKALITQQKEFQDRLETELLAKQDAERQLVAQQISNIPQLVAMDTDLVGLLAQKVRELEAQSEADDS